ncbi:CHAT domain-containing protein [Streptomyces sp. NPDC048330]|uniref:CHAT domain-containing protein n=1 Tax=Streptomyces sp. NPDC048330 TaxID=3365533 RepID=UPI0037191C7C
MRLTDVFSSVSVHFPAIGGQRQVDLADPADVFSAIQEVQKIQGDMTSSPVLLTRSTEALLQDVANLARSETPAASARVRAVLTAAFCHVPAKLAYLNGDVLGMWTWVHCAVGGAVDTQRGTADFDRQALNRLLADAPWESLTATAFLHLSPALFHLAWRHESAVELASDLYPYLYPRCLTNLPAHEGLAESAIQMISWQMRNDRQTDASKLAKALEQMLFANPDMEPAGRAAVLLSIQTLNLTVRPPGDIAKWAAENVKLDLPERFSLRLVAAQRPDPGWASASFAELSGELRCLIQDVRSAGIDPLTESQVRGQIFASFQPAVFDLMRTGEHGKLWRWLAIWQTATDEEARSAPCVAIATAGDGAWLRPGAPLSTTPTDKLAKFTKASNEALGLALVSPGHPDAHLVNPATGRKDYAHAEEFEAALREYVDIEDLASLARASGAESVLSMLPSHAPIQALLARSGGPVLPLSISAQAPLADRAVRRVRVWCGDLESADTEYQIIRTIFENAGLQASSVDATKATREEFLMEYESDSYDVIWVASHGVRPPYRPNDAAVFLCDGEKVTVLDLLEASPPATGQRRLLVLNACDTAASSSQHAFAELGIGRGIVGPAQAVIGHLWPVDTYAALVFGALLAGGLADGSPYATAFADALTLLQKPWTEIGTELQGRGVGSLIAHALQEFQSPTILDWGSAAFMD